MSLRDLMYPFLLSWNSFYTCITAREQKYKKYMKSNKNRLKDWKLPSVCKQNKYKTKNEHRHSGVVKASTTTKSILSYRTQFVYCDHLMRDIERKRKGKFIMPVYQNKKIREIQTAQITSNNRHSNFLSLTDALQI